jgi:hypothetical protein
MFAAMLWFTSRPQEEGPVVRSSGGAQLPPNGKVGTATRQPSATEEAASTAQEAKAGPASENLLKGESELAVVSAEEVDDKQPTASDVARSPAAGSPAPRARRRQRNSIELYDNPYLRRAPEEQDVPTDVPAVAETAVSVP